MGAIYASSPPDNEQLDDDPVDRRIGVERLPLGLRQVGQEKLDEPSALPIGAASADVGFALVAGESGLSAARVASFLALVIYRSLFPCAALAQEPEMPSPVTPAERAQAAIEQITNDFARLETLRAEPLPDTTAEARAIRDRRIGDEELRIGRRVRDLANLMLEAEGDLAMDSVRATVVGWLQELPAGVSLTVERRTAELQAARAARELATADEQNAAELRLTAARKSLNKALGYYAEGVPVIRSLRSGRLCSARRGDSPPGRKGRPAFVLPEGNPPGSGAAGTASLHDTGGFSGEASGT